MTKSQIKDLVNQLGDIVATLNNGDPTDRAGAYAQLGLRLTYQPERRVVTAEAQPTKTCAYVRVRGGT
jgi:site-specific DNA recombinase